MFDYALLEILLAVEKEKDFERAAKSLGVSKSFISQRLRLIEERLGAVVVCRDPVKTTTFGSTLCRHVENIQLLEREFFVKNKKLFNAENPSPASLKVIITDESVFGWLKNTLYKRSQNEAEFSIDTGVMTETEASNSLQDGTVHAAITHTPSKAPVFENYYLGEYLNYAVATPEFIKSFFQTGVTWQNIADAPAMEYLQDDPLRKEWIRKAFGKDANSLADIIPSTHGIVNNCLDHMGWAMNSSLVIEDYLANGDLTELIPGTSISRPLYWNIHKDLISSISGLTQIIRSDARKALLQRSGSNVVVNEFR